MTLFDCVLSIAVSLVFGGLMSYGFIDLYKEYKKECEKEGK